MAPKNKRFQDGTRYLVEGKTLNELFELIQTATLLKGPGYDLAVDPGNGTTLKIKPSGASSTPSWGLVATGSGYTVALGRIYSSYESIDDYVSISSGALVFNPAAGQHLYLELTELDNPVITLKYGTAWPGHPALYQLVDLETTPRVQKSIFPLWSFIPGNLPANEKGYQIHPDFYARQFERQNDLIITLGSYELSDTFREIPIPVLANF